MSQTKPQPFVDAIEQVGENPFDAAMTGSYEQARVILCGFEIPVSESHTGHTSLPPWQLVPIRKTTHTPRGSGAEGVAVTRKNLFGMVTSGQEVTIYPGIFVENWCSAYGIVDDEEHDWGFVDVTPLRNVDKWNHDELRRAGLRTDEIALAKRARRAPWMLLMKKFQAALFPTTLNLYSQRPNEQVDMCTRLRTHVSGVMDQEGATRENPDRGTVLGRVAAVALDSIDGYQRWVENHFRTLDSETFDGGRKYVAGSELKWRRSLNLELPGTLATAGRIPGDPEYNRNSTGMFTDDDRQMIRALIVGAAQNSASTAPEPANVRSHIFKAAVEVEVARRMAMAEKREERAAADPFFSPGEDVITADDASSLDDDDDDIEVEESDEEIVDEPDDADVDDDEGDEDDDEE